MISSAKSEKFTESINNFICSQVIERGLDIRTERAYRLDLEHLREWMEQKGLEEEERLKSSTKRAPLEESSGFAVNGTEWEERIQEYLMYLSREKGLRASTISRKYRVIGYYLRYLAKQGLLRESGWEKGEAKGGAKGGQQSQYQHQKWNQNTLWVLKDAGRPKDAEGFLRAAGSEMPEEESCLSKREVDAFFRAIRREYEELDSDFRRRVCLRDQIMMELLFYHGLEISELLKMEVSDYEPKAGILVIPKKRGKGRTVQLFSKELQEQMGQWLEERQYFEQDNEFQERMFLSKFGRPLSMKMVINIFEKYRLLAGIEKACTPKDLKKSMQGYAWELVREVCG